jgi:hypothetical protein
LEINAFFGDFAEKLILANFGIVFIFTEFWRIYFHLDILFGPMTTKVFRIKFWRIMPSLEILGIT